MCSSDLFLIPSLPSGASVTNLIFVDAKASTFATNITYVASPLPDTAPTNNAYVLTTLIAGEDLALSMNASETNSYVGDTITYLLSVTNLGPSANGAVTITNLLTPNVTIASVNPSQGTYTNFNNTLVINLGVLSAGQSASVSVNATTLQAGSTAVSVATV